MNDERKLSTSDIAEATERKSPAAVPIDDGMPAQAQPRMTEEPPAALFNEGDGLGYRTRWNAIQTGFVDEPRKAVEEVMKRLAEVFAEQRQRLEADWERNDKVSTEDLRQSMRRYRSFFERLLTI